MSDDTNKPVNRVDDKDYIYGWSAQQGPAPVAPDQVPGNVVTVAELPYESSLKDQGIDPAQYRAGLYIADTAAEKAAIKRERPEDRVAEQKAADEANAKQADVRAANEADVKASVVPSDFTPGSGSASAATEGSKNPSTVGTPGSQPPVASEAAPQA